MPAPSTCASASPTSTSPQCQASKAPSKPRLAARGMSCVTPPHQTQKPPNPCAAACATGPSCLAARPSCLAGRPPSPAAGKVKFVPGLELASSKPSALPLPAHLGEGRGSSGVPVAPGQAWWRMRRCRAAGTAGLFQSPGRSLPSWRLSTRDKQPSHVSSSQRKRNPRRRSFSAEGRRH